MEISFLPCLLWTGQPCPSRGYYTVMIQCIRRMLTQKMPVNVLLLKLSWFGFILKRSIKYEHYDKNE